MADTKDKVTRRDLIGGAMGVAAVAVGGCRESTQPVTRSSANSTVAHQPAPVPSAGNHSEPSQGPLRTLGKTGAKVQVVSLGGEGVLRTKNRHRDAVPMIEEAFRLGVRYCDTAPAYQQSQDYYGAALRNMPQARKQIFLASKTHARDRDGSLRLLDDTLTRLGTDHLDLWQLHDLRTKLDLDDIFAKGGAIEAVEKAKADGRVRFVGITGHHSAAILVEAMRRYPVDNVLCAVNPSDPAKAPVITTVIAEARKRNVGVVGMKVMAAGRLLRQRAAAPRELIRYAASYCDTVIIGCGSIAEVRENFAVRNGYADLPAPERASLEARISGQAAHFNTFKA